MYWFALGIEALPLSAKKQVDSATTRLSMMLCSAQSDLLGRNGDLLPLSCFPSSILLFVLAVTDSGERDV